MKSKRQVSKSKRLRKTLFISLGVVIAVGLLVSGVVALKLKSLTKDTVAIVTRPSESQSPTGIATEPSQSPLPSIDGIPDDIDVDYDVEVDNPVEAPIYEAPPTDPNIINVLMLSSDARPGEKNGRSDSMMLLSYNRKSGALKLVSFLRDTWVRIDGHGWNRINAAFAFGGIGLSVNTVNENFNLDIQNYVTIRFEQFITIVDQIGGISLKLTKSEIEYINRANPSKPLSTNAGVKLLNGAQALTHSRNRSVGNGDFDRTRRQRDTMNAVLQKMKQQRDPVKITKIINSALKNVSTNMKSNDIIELAIEALGNKDLSLAQTRVPFDKTWHYANESGRSVIAIDLAENRRLLHQFLYE